VFERSLAVNRNLQRWIPAAVVPAVIVVAAVAVPAAASASPSLPEKTAQQVLELVATSSDAVYSGTVEQKSALGLPDVSALGSGSGDTGSVADALELVTGSHTAQVFVGGPTEQRVQLLEGFDERNVIRNGDSVWLYESNAKKATHVTVTAPSDLPAAPAITPADAAKRLLATVEPSTTIDVIDTARVAGRDAYQLRLTPDDPGTLVGSVVLSVDAESGLPLGASITAKGQKQPAFSVAFSDISFGAPDDALFDFTPPKGATVTEKSIDAKADDAQSGDANRAPDAAAHAGPEPTLIGDGWDAVVVVPADAARTAKSGEAGAMLDRLTTKVDGGRALSTSLVSVFIADDGRVLVGAVSTDLLQAAAAQ
jgi:outer membrane lipoprotein-sorting protein